MKRSLLIIFSLSIFSAVSFGQIEQAQIENIDNICADIKNNIASYKKVQKYRDSTGTRHAFLKDKALKLVRSETTDNILDKKVEWYFLNGQLIFCEQTWTVIVSKKIFNHERLYLDKGRLILWLNTSGKPVSPTSGEFKETDHGLVAYGKTLVAEAAQ